MGAARGSVALNLRGRSVAGTLLGPYEIGSPLGAGGMGEVYPRAGYAPETDNSRMVGYTEVGIPPVVRR